MALQLGGTADVILDQDVLIQVYGCLTAASLVQSQQERLDDRRSIFDVPACSECETEKERFSSYGKTQHQTNRGPEQFDS